MVILVPLSPLPQLNQELSAFSDGYINGTGSSAFGAITPVQGHSAAIGTDCLNSKLGVFAGPQCKHLLNSGKLTVAQIGTVLIQPLNDVRGLRCWHRVRRVITVPPEAIYE